MPKKISQDIATIAKISISIVHNKTQHSRTHEQPSKRCSQIKRSLHTNNQAPANTRTTKQTLFAANQTSAKQIKRSLHTNNQAPADTRTSKQHPARGKNSLTHAPTYLRSS